MKYLNLLFILVLFGCNTNPKKETVVEIDTVAVQPTKTIEPKEEVVTPKSYENERFKEVSVSKTGDNEFTITGKAQVFEANFNWKIEDGHETLQKSFVTADAGAPDWGNFKFTVKVEKKRANSTLNLIIFEASAKDGSPQFELPIVLY